MTVLDVSHHNPPGTPAQAQAIIIRTAYGLTPDGAAAEHNRRADDARLPRMFYWYPLSRRDPVAQAELAFQGSGGATGRRGWIDLEESAGNDGAEPQFPHYSEAYWQHVNAGLTRADALTGLTAGIYSSAAWLNRWFTPEQQERWSKPTATRPGRMLWVAHWKSPNGWPPAPDMPLGWTTYALWQTGAGPWPGMTGNVDQSQLAPGLTLAELLGSVPVTGRTKLGLHHGTGGRDARQWATVATVMKYVGDLGASNDAPADVLCVGRVVDDGAFAGQGFDANRMEQTIAPKDAAAQYVAFLADKIRLNPRITVWEGPNEQVITAQDVMAWYGAFSHEFAWLLKGLGKRAGLGAWAVGTPAFDLWPFWTLALQATVDFGAVLTRHEYGPPNGFLGLRYRVDQREFTKLGYSAVPLIISECGGDNVPGSGPWKLYYRTIDRYWDELLRPYALELEQDAYVLGATVFTDGGGWPDFDVSGSWLVDKVIALAAGLPPALPPTGDDELSTSQKERIEAELVKAETAHAAIRNILAEADAPPVLFRVQVKAGITLNIRAADNSASADIGDLLAGAIVSVYRVSAATGWYKIDPAAEKWISGNALYTTRLP